MKEIILIKIGEIVLKGLNRKNFEDKLIKNIKRKISPLGEFEIKNQQSTITLIPKNDDIDFDDVCYKISKIFGIAAFSRAAICEKEMSTIKETAREYLYKRLKTSKTFKVESKRSDKKFSLKSPQISADVGEYILEKFNNLTVDVHNPDIIITVEIRDSFAYIRGESLPGAGGIPVGTGGKAAVLISGGIDSPVASFMIAKRGVDLVAIHFASPPYTSPRAEEKVKLLIEKVSSFANRIELIIVPFTKIQEEIKRGCPDELFTIIMRRFMMRISEVIAKNHQCFALITGESLGQVASQTIEAIACTDPATSMPVFRPLIGMDKDEIVLISRKIETFDISILPYEDCCTVFTPKHPKTKPVLSAVVEAESKLSLEGLINDAILNIKSQIIYG
ncbi:MAG: putative tRNA sulfurtransferase [Eubacteriales bacterium SKADARSKE-1]|nr:putative tRNA sulfurtransferase [Eubacteriales bacterium SKADARSKE-1]